MKIIAGIVAYNPKQDRFKQNVEQISKQVDYVYIYNNGMDISILKSINCKNYMLLGDGKNIGLAKALNCIMEESAKDKSVEWVITLDQDSIVPKDIIEKFSKYFKEKDVAIVCPQVIDKRRPYMKIEKGKKTYVNRCITSASCTRLKAWENVGKFDENLFIDLIDNDFCKRLIISNWKILKVNSIVLDQEFGDIQLKKQWKVNLIMKISKMIKNKNLATNFAKFTYKKNVSPTRVYYSNRNIIYLNRKFKKYGGIGYECYNCKTYFGFHICFNLPSIIRGKKKIQIIKSIVKGIKDGKKIEYELFDVK